MQSAIKKKMQTKQSNIDFYGCWSRFNSPSRYSSSPTVDILGFAPTDVVDVDVGKVEDGEDMLVMVEESFKAE